MLNAAIRLALRVAEVAVIPVEVNDRRPVLLRQVARVVEVPQPPRRRQRSARRRAHRHQVHLMRHEGETFTAAMVLRGSLERLPPVVVTALTAGLGLVPLVVEGHAPGRETVHPVATVILGGLVTSTLCEFLVHPGLFWRFSGKDAERLARPAEEGAEI